MFEILDNHRIKITADRGNLSVMAGTPPTVEIDQKYPSRQLQQYFDILVRAKAIKVRKGLNGFHVEYPNGVTVSAFFGYGSYSDNHGDYDSPLCGDGPDTSANTELMILSSRPEVDKCLTLTGEFKEEGEWGTLDYQTSEDVLRALQWAERFSKEVLEEMFASAPTEKERLEKMRRDLDACLARMEDKAAKEKAEKEPKRLEATNVR